MACIELKLEVKTTLKNKDLATLVFKKIHLYSQTAIHETLGLGAYCVPKLICFSSLNTGRVNNQTPLHCHGNNYTQSDLWVTTL